MKANAQTFFGNVLPMAQAIHARTGNKMLAATLLCQFAVETGWDTDGCAQGHEGWAGKNNFAGISLDGKLVDFPNRDSFVDAYVKTIEQNAFGYPEVLAAENEVLQMVRLGRSQWAGSQYDSTKTGRPGNDLLGVYNAHASLINGLLSGVVSTEPLLQKGDQGEAVKILQGKLGITADGIFGQHTFDAVVAFQRAHNLGVDGIVGTQTWAALNAPKVAETVAVPPATQVPAPTAPQEPAQVVETNGDFGWAIANLKDGSKVGREGWNGKGMYLFFIGVDHNDYWTYTNGRNDNYSLAPFIAMKTADDKVVPWLASQTDMLAEDWKLVEN